MLLVSMEHILTLHNVTQALGVKFYTEAKLQTSVSSYLQVCGFVHCNNYIFYVSGLWCDILYSLIYCSFYFIVLYYEKM